MWYWSRIASEDIADNRMSLIIPIVLYAVTVLYFELLGHPHGHRQAVVSTNERLSPVTLKGQ
jgi:hypothetical protein